MEKEYLIMDDGGNVMAEQITPEMLAVYESVKNKIVEDYKNMVE